MKTGSITVWEDVCSGCGSTCEVNVTTIEKTSGLSRVYRRSACCNKKTFARQAPQAIGTPVGEAT